MEAEIKKVQEMLADAIQRLQKLEQTRPSIKVLEQKLDSGLADVRREAQSVQGNIEKGPHTINLKKARDPVTQLVISNYPYKEGEDLQKLIRQIAAAKEIQLPSSEINCFRTSKKGKANDNNRPPNIVLKLKTSSMKKQMKKSQPGKALCITDMKELTISCMDYQEARTGEHPMIYINENLTSDQSFIFWKTRQHKATHNYKFAWTTDGISFLKKYEGERIHAIHSLEDLNKLD